MKSLLTFYLFLIIILFPIWILSQGTEGHARFDIACGDCHITVPKDGDDPRHMTFLKDVSLLCKECHDMVKKASHPVDVKPSMDIPEYFPLNWQGRNTCITCHAAHKGGYGKYFLRSERTGKGFCMECHGKNIEDGVGMHKGMVGSAHFGSRYVEEDKGVTIDELSAVCLSCHDGQLAGNASVIILGSGAFEHSDRVGVTHPIGIDYIKASLNNNRLVSPSLLHKEIKLFKGKVGCGTCHNPFSDRHSQLVMGNSRSALCFACHIIIRQWRIYV